MDFTVGVIHTGPRSDDPGVPTKKLFGVSRSVRIDLDWPRPEATQARSLKVSQRTYHSVETDDSPPSTKGPTGRPLTVVPVEGYIGIGGTGVVSPITGPLGPRRPTSGAKDTTGHSTNDRVDVEGPVVHY